MAKVLRHIIIIFLVLAWAGAAVGEATYSIDGDISDWGVTLETYKLSYWNYSWFDQDSFDPDPVGTIQYNVEDYWESDSQPSGGEQYDIEAVYLDADCESLYFGIISSLPWGGVSGYYPIVTVVANGVSYTHSKYTTSPFAEFAIGDLGITDGGKANYFFEGMIAASDFLDPGADTYSVNIAVTESCNNDSIGLCADIDCPSPGPGPGPIPEPGTMALLGLGLAGLVARKRRK